MTLQVDLLETSFDLIAPDGEKLMDTFYARLFETAPSVKPLFEKADLRKQKAMLLGALVLVRKSLRDLDRIVPSLRALGARHVAYGAESAHYAIVGEVLLASMAEIAGSAWRPEYETAWAEAYGLVASVMLEGAATGELAEAA